MKKLLLLVTCLCVFSPRLQAEDAGLTAIYSLPYNSEYKDFLSYKFEILNWSDQDNNLVFKYVLPEDLVGVAGMDMTMFGEYVADDVFFQIFCNRTASEGMCVKKGDLIACSVKFKNIPLNTDVTNAFLETKYGDDHIVERKRAADSFLRDAIGNISIAIRR